MIHVNEVADDLDMNYESFSLTCVDNHHAAGGTVVTCDGGKYESKKEGKRSRSLRANTSQNLSHEYGRKIKKRIYIYVD